MSENKKVDSINNETPSNNGTFKETAEAKADLLTATGEQSSEKLTVDYLLGKLEEISHDQPFLIAAISELGKMDVGAQERARAVGEIIKAREATNQKLIALYEKMYDDLTLQTSLKEMAMKALEKAADDEDKIAAVSDALDTIRHLG